MSPDFSNDQDPAGNPLRFRMNSLQLSSLQQRHGATFYMCLIANLNDQLPRRLSARKVGLGLLHTLSTEGVFVEDVDLHDTLAHDIEKELGVVGALLGSDHVVHHYRTQKLDVLLSKLEGRERRDSAGGIPEGNECPFPLQHLEIVVEP